MLRISLLGETNKFTIYIFEFKIFIYESLDYKLESKVKSCKKN